MPAVAPTNCDSAHKVRSQRRIKRKELSLSRDADMGLRWNWRRLSLQKCTPSHFRKHQDVEEVHDAKHEHHHADLATDRFEHFANICGSDALLQSKRYVADIDKIEANDKKVIDRVRQSLGAAERINQKNAPVFIQRMRDPDGERNAQRDVNNVSPNYWSHGSFLSLVLVFNGDVILVSKTSGPREPSCFALTG